MIKMIKFLIISGILIGLSSCSTKQDLEVVHMVSVKKQNTIFMAKLLKDNEQQKRYIKTIKFSNDGKPIMDYGYIKLINKPPLGSDGYIDVDTVVLDEIFVDNYDRVYLAGTTSSKNKQIIIWKFSKTGQPDLSYGDNSSLNHILISGLCSDMGKRQITTDRQNNFYMVCAGDDDGEEVLFIRKYDIDGKLIKSFGQDGVSVLK